MRKNIIVTQLGAIMSDLALMLLVYYGILPRWEFMALTTLAIFGSALTIAIFLVKDAENLLRDFTSGLVANLIILGIGLPALVSLVHLPKIWSLVIIAFCFIWDLSKITNTR